MTNFSSEIFLFFCFLFFCSFLFSASKKNNGYQGERGLIIRLYEDKRGERRGSYVEVRLVQQNRVQVLKRYSVGGWSHREPRELGRACGPANQVVPSVGSQHFDWLISRGEALPSSLT